MSLVGALRASRICGYIGLVVTVRRLSAMSINRLFEIERTLGAVSPDERKAARLKRSKPVLDEFKRWLDSASSKVLPKSVLGEAVNYCRNQWPKLIVFLEDGRLELSNNRAERSIKPFVIGRKNWLFANTPRGAKTSAVI